MTKAMVCIAAIVALVFTFDTAAAQSEDDPAQEFTARVQAMTIRTDLVGPTGIELWDGPLRWRATVGYRRFLEGDLSGANDFVRLGGALELGDVLPLGSTLALSAAAILGDDIDGWALGLGISF